MSGLRSSYFVHAAKKGGRKTEPTYKWKLSSKAWMADESILKKVRKAHLSHVKMTIVNAEPWHQFDHSFACSRSNVEFRFVPPPAT